MSREIFRRSHRTGLVSADIVRPSVETLAELEKLTVSDIWDGSLILVQKSSALYFYDRNSTDTPDGVSIIQPPNVTGDGRWLKIGFGGTSSATSGSADRWVDVTKIVEDEEIVVDKASGDDWPQEVRRDLIDVTEAGATLTVDDGYVLSGPENLAETLAVFNQTQGNDIELTSGDHLIMPQNPPPTTASGTGVFFVGDGTSGTDAGEAYFRAPSSGPVTRLSVGTAVELKAYAFDSASPIVLCSMGLGDVVVQVIVEVAVAFNDPNPLITVGSSSAPTDLVDGSGVDLTTPGQYTSTVLSSGTSTDDVVITLSPGTSTTGSGRVVAIIYRS